MDTHQKYVIDSLEQHLFSARIMKEHALFLKLGFMPPNADMAKEGERLMKKFESLLSRTISLSDCVVRCCTLKAGEFFTEFTDCAERKTQCLTGTAIDRSLTSRAKKLKGLENADNLCVSHDLLRQVCKLNRDAIQLVDCIISFKERVLCDVNSCNIFTVNYPLLIEHILREARLYRDNLLKLEGIEDCRRSDRQSSESFWNQIMMEHALFMRGLLDPSEEKLIDTADEFADEYKKLLKASRTASDKVMQCDSSLALTEKFRDFNKAGVEGIEACKIRSLILPLLADHVLREANHYIRLLES